MVLDDSGSMGTRIKGTNKTRWDELKEVAQIAISIAAALDDDGMDILFLNRPGKKGVRSWSDAESLFKAPPSGTTPLTEATYKVFHSAKPTKPLLCLIATDGVPDNLGSFTDLLKKRDPSKIYVSILACSDNDKDVGYLNKLDAEVQNLDVVDDYQSEYAEVKKRHGNQDVPYTLGDHVAKYLLGSVFPAYDQLDGF